MMPDRSATKTLLPVYIDTQDGRTERISLPVGEAIDTAATAKKLCKDLRLPPNHDQLIKRQLEHVLRVFNDASAIDCTAKQIVTINIEVPYLNNSMYYIDAVSWDLNSPLALVEMYVSAVANELKIPIEGTEAIIKKMSQSVLAMREKVKAGSLIPEAEIDPANIARKKHFALPAVFTRDHLERVRQQAQKAQGSAEKAAIETIKEEDETMVDAS